MGDLVRRFVPMGQRRLVDPSVWTPAALPGCILYGGAYLEARAVRAAQPNLVNTGFVTDTDWTKTAGWTISGGKALRSGAGGVSSSIRQGATIIGNRYLTTIEVDSVGAGAGVADNVGAWVYKLDTGLVTWEHTCVNAQFGIVGSTTTDCVIDSYNSANLSLTSYTPAYTTIPGSVLAQATATAQPWVSSDGLGIRYQGGDAFLWNAAKSNLKCLHDGTGGTVIVAVRPAALSATQLPVATTDAAGTGPGMMLRYTNANQVGIAIANGAGVAVNANFAQTISVGNTYVIAATIAAGTNGVVVYCNGSPIGTDTIAAPSANDPLYNLSIGANGGYAAPIDGNAGHLFVANRALSTAEILQISNYILAQATL